MSLMIEVRPRSLLVKLSFPVLIERRDLKHVTWEAEHSSFKSVQVFHTLLSSADAVPTTGAPHGLEIAFILF